MLCRVTHSADKAFEFAICSRGPVRKGQDQTADDATSQNGVPGRQRGLGQNHEPSLNKRALLSGIFCRRTPHLAEEVQKVVQQVFGEVAVSKIAHSRKLIKGISEEEIDKTYRSEQALTLGLMGLMAEESLIAQRLTKLGRKKQNV